MLLRRENFPKAGITIGILDVRALFLRHSSNPASMR
jgi:hypothetical protein